MTKGTDPAAAILGIATQFGPDAAKRVTDMANQIGGAGNRNPQSWMMAAEQVLGVQAGRQIRIKAGLDPKPNEWNPFRADNPNPQPTGGRQLGPMGTKRPSNTPGYDLIQAGIAAAGPPQTAGAPGIGGPSGTLADILGLGDGGGDGAGAGAGGGGAYVPPLSPNATDAETEAFIRRNFGFAAWALDQPELRGALVGFTKRMQGQPFTEDQLEAELLTTDWWKTKGAVQRERIQQFQEDPAEYNRGLGVVNTKVANLAGTIGFDVKPERLKQIADTAYSLGWDDVEIRAALAAEFDYNPDTGAQAESLIVGNLKNLAGDFLIPLSEQTIDQWGRDIIAGKATEESFSAYARAQAQTLFPVFSKQLEAGQTMSQLIDPYKQLASKYLEMDGGAIDWTDPKWMRTLEATNPDGTRTVSGLAAFTDKIRTDPNFGWDKTKNAQEHAASVATGLAKQMGYL